MQAPGSRREKAPDRASGARREKAPDAVDLRLVPVALTVWAGAWAAVGGGDPARAWAAVGAAGSGGLALALVPALLRFRPPRHRADPRPGSDGLRGSVAASVFLCALALAALLATAAVQLHLRAQDPLAAAVREGRTVTLVATVAAEPRPLASAGSGARWLVDLDVESVDGSPSRAGAVVLGGDAWDAVGLGDVVRVRARPRPTQAGSREVAFIGSGSAPRVLAPAGGVLATVSGLRHALVAAVGEEPPTSVGASGVAGTRVGGAGTGDGGTGPGQGAVDGTTWAWPAGTRALVPGVALGDDSALPTAVREDMRTVSMTHLTAVSGQHVAIVLGLVLTGLGTLPRRWRALVGAVVLALLVVLVRPGGSVLRAAVMGAVVLAGVAAGRRSASLPALGAAVVVLLLVDPWQARDYGFALSVCATAGILLGARRVEAVASTRVPRWLAAGLALPLVAQAACLPVLVLLQPRWSPWAVAANVVAAPVVPVATVSGLLGALVAPVWPAAGRVVAWPALASCGWLALVARTAAHLPGASLGWPAGPGGAVLMALAEASLVLVVRGWWRRRRRTRAP